MVQYNIPPQIGYNWIIIIYFFLSGLSAGIFFFTVVANYWLKDFKFLVKKCAILVPIILGIGMFILFLDLGKPHRVWRLFLTFKPTSVMTWGFWFLNIFFVLSVVHAWMLNKMENEKDKIKIISYAGLVFGFLVATYSGILLSQKVGRVIWHTSIMPWKFLAGGLASGLAFIIIYFAKKVKTELLSKLGKVISGLLMLEMGFIITELILLFTGEAEAVNAVKVLTGGSFSFSFWVLEIFLGAFVPIYIFLKLKLNHITLTVASSLVLIGIFTMRYIIVIGGQVIR